MRMNARSRLSTLTAVAFIALVLGACEDEPEETREQLDDAIGQREVQDLLRNEDDPELPQQEGRDETEEQEQR